MCQGHFNPEGGLVDAKLPGHIDDAMIAAFFEILAVDHAIAGTHLNAALIFEIFRHLDACPSI